MTKKRFLFISLLLAMLLSNSIATYAHIVDLESGYVDPEYGNDGQQKSPVLVPTVDLEVYTLTFYTPCDGCVLRLIDENDVEVYSTVIPTGATSLVLPSYLSGEYEIQIVQGNTYFYGYINL